LDDTGLIKMSSDKQSSEQFSRAMTNGLIEGARFKFSNDLVSDSDVLVRQREESRSRILEDNGDEQEFRSIYSLLRFFH